MNCVRLLTQAELSHGATCDADACQAPATWLCEAWPDSFRRVGYCGTHLKLGLRGKAPPRGFAAVNPEKRREIAASGGRAAHAHGTAHKFTTDEARAAGRKGGEAVREKYGASYMREIGAHGGIRRVERERERRGG